MGWLVVVRRLCNVQFFDSKMSFTPNRRSLEVQTSKKNPDHCGREEKEGKKRLNLKITRFYVYFIF